MESAVEAEVDCAHDVVHESPGLSNVGKPRNLLAMWRI